MKGEKLIETYFCTACGEHHKVEKDFIPQTAGEIHENHPNAPKWLSAYEVEDGEKEGICEECYEALLIDGTPNFPAHDLLG